MQALGNHIIEGTAGQDIREGFAQLICTGFIIVFLIGITAAVSGFGIDHKGGIGLIPWGIHQNH